MVYVLMVDGFEDTEAIAPMDMLSRAGIEFKKVGVMGRVVTSKMGFPMTADLTAEELDLSDCEMIFLPGGPGTKNYFDYTIVDTAIEYCKANNLYIAAICAAPSVLAAKNALNGKNAVCHFSVREKMTGCTLLNQGVCVDGKVITGQGAAASIDFGLALVEQLRGPEAAAQVKHGICYVD